MRISSFVLVVLGLTCLGSIGLANGLCGNATNGGLKARLDNRVTRHPEPLNGVGFDSTLLSDPDARQSMSSPTQVAQEEGCPPGKPLDCGNGYCCPEGHTYFCGHLIPGNPTACFDPNDLTNEQLSYLAGHCSPWASCN